VLINILLFTSLTFCKTVRINLSVVHTENLIYRRMVISSTIYAHVFCTKVLSYFCQSQNVTREKLPKALLYKKKLACKMLMKLTPTFSNNDISRIQSCLRFPSYYTGRCQFHQHFTRTFFVRKSFEQLFSA